MLFYSKGKGMGANHPCSDLYPGERPFSEIESSNIADYLSKHQHKMVAFFDVHSYSKLWISPWGWKDKKPPEYSSQMVSSMCSSFSTLLVGILNNYFTSAHWILKGHVIANKRE